MSPLYLFWNNQLINKPENIICQDGKMPLWLVTFVTDWRKNSKEEEKEEEMEEEEEEEGEEENKMKDPTRAQPLLYQIP